MSNSESIESIAASVARIAATRAQLWESGFRPVAICNWDDVGIPLASRGKRPLDSGWQIQARLDPPRAAIGGVSAEQLNTGILCDGLRAFDLDIDDPELSGQCRSVIFDLLGEAPARYRENSGRCLILYRAAAGEPEKRVLAGRLGKVEVLGRGQQFVAFGRHVSGVDLYWYPDPPGIETLDELPAVTEGQVMEALAALAGLIGAGEPVELQRQTGLQPGLPWSADQHGPREGAPSNGAANWDSGVGGHKDTSATEADHRGAAKGQDELQADDPLMLISALQAIPNSATAPANWVAWNDTGMALWAATAGSALGRAAWHAWSARHPAYDGALCDERWNHYFRSPPNRIGAGSLFHRAEEHRWKRPVERILRPREPGKEDEETFPLEMFKDVAISSEIADFVEGLLISASMSVVYGESNSGKTFFATDLALHIAQGIPWNGLATDQGGVLYLALEGSHGIRHRIAAFRHHHGLVGHDLPFAIVPVTMDLLDPKADTEKLIATIRHFAKSLFPAPIRLVVVDTLSRAMAGGNENAPDDMGALVTNGTRIQQTTGAAVLWVHHSGKDQARGARGHSLLRAATDTEIEISANDTGQRLARVTKQRELECSGEFFFQLRVVELGKNQRSKPVTSCVVEYGDPMHGDAVEKASRSLPGHAKRAYEVLVDLCASQGRSGFDGTPSSILSVPEEWWRERFYDRAMPGEKDDTKLKAFRRSSEKLLNQHLVGMANKRVWVVAKYDPSDHNVSYDDNRSDE